MKTTMHVVVGSALVVGLYGCRQIIGWEEATVVPADAGVDGGEVGGGGSGGAGGAAGAAGGGMGGAGGVAGMGGSAGMGGGGGGAGGCVTVADCPGVTNATTTCKSGVCGFTCKSGFGDCTASSGCETVLTDNEEHCGACVNVCGSKCEGTACNDPVSIAGGYHHHCAVMKNGDVYCWGRNEKGELGDGTTDDRWKPTKVKGLPGPALQVDGGASVTANNYTPKTCAVLKNGELWCWGAGSGTPAQVIQLSDIKEVSVGDGHVCAVSNAGTLYCWGGNNDGQVGDASGGYVATPKPILTGTSHVSAGGQHTCAVKLNGSVQCWGNNDAGQLGIGNKTEQNVPALVTAIVDAQEIRAGNAHTCAIAGATLYCWGTNQVGQLGIGAGIESTIPIAVNLSNAKSVETGYNFSGAIAGGTPMMWGYNLNGQLGNGTTTQVNFPVSSGLSNIEAVRVGLVSACALAQNGEVRCWGGNDYGQLGNDGTAQALLPTPVVWP